MSDLGADANYNAIITKAARMVLKPLGLFQKGRSRIWVDDNGWFLTLVEFQPSSWDRGSYLNIGVCFLWSQQDYLSFDYGGRASAFIRFNGDETAFYDAMVPLAERAAETVLEYRNFHVLSYAREHILHQRKRPGDTHDLYHKMMICGLVKDGMAVEFYNQLLEQLQSSTLSWEQAYHTELTRHIAEVIHDPEKFHCYIIEKISTQRSFWRAKSSMKQLRPYDTEEGILCCRKTP